jgi:hypothetical protein
MKGKKLAFIDIETTGRCGKGGFESENGSEKYYFD